MVSQSQPCAETGPYPSSPEAQQANVTLSAVELVWLARAVGQLSVEFQDGAEREEDADAPTHADFTPAVVQAWRERAAMLANLQRKLNLSAAALKERP